MNPTHPCAVDPLEPVHRVVNPAEFNQRAVSLHVYSRPFDTCVVYSPEQGTCGEIKLHYTSEYGKTRTEGLTRSRFASFVTPQPAAPLRSFERLRCDEDRFCLDWHCSSLLAGCSKSSSHGKP